MASGSVVIFISEGTPEKIALSMAPRISFGSVINSPYPPSTLTIS